jgi:chemotaxis receptor (MCP) glutamine deamidase CheD
MPTTTHREVVVAPDRFEVVSDDAVLSAELLSATAVCIYDAVEEAGALLHLRFIIRSAKPVDVTDTTLATELLLLDRCIESLREAAPGSKNLQAKIAAHLPESADAQRACESVLTLVRHFLDDSGMTVVTSDVAAGAAARQLRFRPSMGWLQIK